MPTFNSMGAAKGGGDMGFFEDQKPKRQPTPVNTPAWADPNQPEVQAFPIPPVAAAPQAPQQRPPTLPMNMPPGVFNPMRSFPGRGMEMGKAAPPPFIPAPEMPLPASVAMAPPTSFEDQLLEREMQRQTQRPMRQPGGAIGRLFGGLVGRR